MATDFSFVKPEGWVALKPNFERSEKKLKRRVEKKDFGAEQGQRLTKLMKDKYDRWSRGEGKGKEEDATVMQQREKVPSKKFASAMQRLAYLGRLALEELTSYVLDGTLQNAAVFQQALELNKTTVPEYFKLLAERISDPEFFGKVADGANMMPGGMIRALSQKFNDWGFAAEAKPVIDAARMVDTKQVQQAPAAAPAPVPAVPGEQVTVDEPAPAPQAQGALPAKPGWATVEPQPWPKDITVPPPSTSGPRFRWYVQYTPKDGSGAMRAGVVDGLNEHAVYAFYQELEKRFVVNNFRAIAKEAANGGWQPLPGAATAKAPAATPKPGHTGQEQQAPGRIDQFDVSDPKAYHWDIKFQNQSGHVGDEHLELTGAQLKQKLRMYARQNLKVIEMINRDAKISASPETAVPGEAITDAAPAARAKVEAPDVSDPQLYRWHFKVQIGNGPEKDMTEDLTSAQAAARLKEYPPMGIKVLELTKMSIVNTASIVVTDSDLRFAADGEPEEKFQNGTPIIFKEDVNLKFDALSAHGQIKKNMTGKIKKVEDNDFLIDIAGQMYRLPRLVAEHVMDVFAATVIPSDQQAAQAGGPEAPAPGAAPAAGAAPAVPPQPQAQPPAPKPQAPAAPAPQAPAAPQPVAAVHGTIVTADAMEVVQDDIWLCSDCMQAAVNDEYSGLQEHLKEPELTAKIEQIRAGLSKLGPHLVPDFSVGDFDKDKSVGGEEEFSRRPCDCCGDHLAGARFRFAVLGEEKPQAQAAVDGTVVTAADAEHGEHDDLQTPQEYALMQQRFQNKGGKLCEFCAKPTDGAATCTRHEPRGGGCKWPAFCEDCETGAHQDDALDRAHAAQSADVDPEDPDGVRRQARFEAAGMPRAAGTTNPQGGDLATFDDLHTILKDSDKNHIKFKDKNDAAALPNQTAAVKQQGFADLLLLIESGAPGIPSEIGKRLYRADGAVSRVTV